MEKSVHPFAPYIPEGATKLLIGTIPPHRFCVHSLDAEKDVDFYYGSKDNYFWSLLSEATGIPLQYYKNCTEAVQERKDLLAKLGIGITDIIDQCVHKNGRSDDASLEVIELKPLRTLLKEYPNINTLYYTSEYVKKLINTCGIADKSYHNCVDKKSRQYSVFIEGKEYQVVILYSPSPNALRSISKENRLTQYKKVFKR